MRTSFPTHRFLLTLVASMIALAAGASAASAATPIGQRCSASNGGPPVMFQSAVSSGASYKAATDGVLTKWGIDTSAWGSSSVLAAVIGSSQGGQWTIVTGTPFELVPSNSVSEYPARVRISAGQTLGLAATNSTNLMCSGYIGPTGDVIEYAGSYLPAGSVFTPAGTIAAYRVPIYGSLEPDVDKDGYGDDTQDACPQSPALQNACPVLSISQKLSASRSAISVLASASVDTSLTASASVKVPKIGKSKSKTVKFRSKATSFKAGKLKAISLKLPSGVKKAVSAGKTLKVTVTLSGNGLANTATTKSTIKLKR